MSRVALFLLAITISASIAHAASLRSQSLTRKDPTPAEMEQIRAMFQSIGKLDVANAMLNLLPEFSGFTADFKKSVTAMHGACGKESGLSAEASEKLEKLKAEVEKADEAGNPNDKPPSDAEFAQMKKDCKDTFAFFKLHIKKDGVSRKCKNAFVTLKPMKRRFLALIDRVQPAFKEFFGVIADLEAGRLVPPPPADASVAPAITAGAFIQKKNSLKALVAFIQRYGSGFRGGLGKGIL